MTHQVVIENEFLRAEVWPQFGAKVSSIRDKADGYELLFNYPQELPTRPLYDASYMANSHGGWDECLPAIAPGPYVGHPYNGVAVPDHGELWGLPTTAVPTRNGITTVWHGLRFGYRLTRKLYVDRSSLCAEYSLINLAPFPFHFVWAMHALLGMETPLELRPPPGRYRLSHDAERRQIDAEFTWPTLVEGDDLSQPSALPAKRGWKAFSAEPISAAAEVHYPRRSRLLRIAYNSEDQMPAYWGVWINTGGWAAQRHASIQPATGLHDELAAAVRDRSCGTVDPLGRRDWSVRWTVA